jgi:oligopeptide transport system substrate-binding protein
MSADYMDPTTFLCMLISSAQQKPVVTDSKYDGLIAAAEATLDPTERLQKLHEAEKYLVEEMAYTIPVFGYASVYLLNPNASGIGFDPVGNVYLEYVECTK